MYTHWNALVARICEQEPDGDDGLFVHMMCCTLETEVSVSHSDYGNLVVPIVTEWLDHFQEEILERIRLRTTSRRRYVCGPTYTLEMMIAQGTDFAPLYSARWNLWRDRYIEHGGPPEKMKKAFEWQDGRMQ